MTETWREMGDEPKDGTPFAAYFHDCDATLIVHWKGEHIMLMWDGESILNEPAGWFPIPTPKTEWLPWWERKKA